MPPVPPTRSSAPKLSEAARHFIVPKGAVSTGFPAVERTCLRLKIAFEPWQAGAGTAILSKNADGLYAADAVVISIPRQVGKTFLVGSIIFALAIINHVQRLEGACGVAGDGSACAEDL
jgi:phage terminase large subunit-like protein